MFSQLLDVFRRPNPLTEMATLFTEMMQTTYRMNRTAGKLVFENEIRSGEKKELFMADVSVNKNERELRRLAISHLAVGVDGSTIPYTLLLIHLVKDVERLGDYTKNLMELRDFYKDPFPSGSDADELREIRKISDSAFSVVREVLEGKDHDQAMEWIRQLKDVGSRCDQLLPAIAASGAPTADAVLLTACARYYKRISGHLLNLFTSVVMPLHKVDYFDEDGIEPDSN